MNRPVLVGSRLALIAVALYLAEFIGLTASGAEHMPKIAGSSPTEIAHTYAGQADALGFLIGWLGLVEPGRILFVIAVIIAMTRSGRSYPVLWWAAALMGVGVVLEIAMEALAAGAAELFAQSNTTGALALDRAGWYLESAIYVPTGLAVLVTVGVMWHSRLFNRVSCGFGLVGGLTSIAAGLCSGPASVDLQDTLSTGTILAWVWMIWTGVVLWRRAPRQGRLESVREPVVA